MVAVLRLGPWMLWLVTFVEIENLVFYIVYLDSKINIFFDETWVKLRSNCHQTIVQSWLFTVCCQFQLLSWSAMTSSLVIIYHHQMITNNYITQTQKKLDPKRGLKTNPLLLYTRLLLNLYQFLELI